MIKKLLIYSLIIIICSCKKENKIINPPVIPPTQNSNIADTIEWQKCLGGSNFDVGKFAIQTSDGGYAIIGEAISMDGDVTGQHSANYSDMWMVKLNNLGSIQWQKCLGGTILEYASSLQQTTDGGYILSGGTSSNDGDVNGNHSTLGRTDSWIIKLDNSGSIQWKKCYGGTANEAANCIQQTTDGGFIAVGYTQSNDSDVVGYHGGNSDIWLIKINNTGGLSWQKCLGGAGMDIGYAIQQTTDGGYIIAGETNSSDGDVASNWGGSKKGWIIKLNSTGGMQWNKCVGAEGQGDLKSIQQTSDGGYIATGSTEGNTLNHGFYDAMVVKFNSTGGVIWNKCYGGTNYDYGESIIQNIDGNYTLAASSMSNDGDVSGNHSTLNLDFWIVGLDTLGAIQWKKCYGGYFPDQVSSIMQTTDEGYIVCGSSKSNDNDVSGNHSSDYDFWIFKLF
jgi:hypothetical protein